MLTILGLTISIVFTFRARHDCGAYQVVAVVFKLNITCTKHRVSVS